MRWARSLPSTVFLLSAVQALLHGPLSPATTDGLPLSTASAGGSELPWWTPIAVSLVFLSAALVYWWRHRPRRPKDEPGEPELSAETGDAFAPDEPAPEPGPEPDDGVFPPPRFGGLLRPVPLR
jgi:hypothetical protein